MQCLDCHNYCIKCYGVQQNECEVCKKSYFKQENSCLLSCTDS